MNQVEPVIYRQNDCIRLSAELGLPPLVRKLIRGEGLEHPLDIYFGWPEEYFLMTDEEITDHGWDNLAPLWDDGNFGYVTGYHPSSKRFVRWHVEDCVNLSDIPECNWQQILIEQFCRLTEFDIDAEYIRRVAHWFHFEYADEIINAYAYPNLDVDSLQHELFQRAADP